MISFSLSELVLANPKHFSHKQLTYELSPLKRRSEFALKYSSFKKKIRHFSKCKKVNWLLLKNIYHHYPFAELLVKTKFLNRISTTTLRHSFLMVLQWFRCVLFLLPHSHISYVYPHFPACSKHLYPGFTDHSSLFCVLSKTFAPSLSSSCVSPSHSSLDTVLQILHLRLQPALVPIARALSLSLLSGIRSAQQHKSSQFDHASVCCQHTYTYTVLTPQKCTPPLTGGPAHKGNIPTFIHSTEA